MSSGITNACEFYVLVEKGLLLVPKAACRSEGVVLLYCRPHDGIWERVRSVSIPAARWLEELLRV